MKTFLTILTVALVTAFAPVAEARDHHHHRHYYRDHHHHHGGWSLSIGPRYYGYGYNPGYYYSRPVYYYPRPVYYSTPVYYGRSYGRWW